MKRALNRPFLVLKREDRPMLDKKFNFADAETRIYDAWETSGAFKPSEEGEPFTIVIPPPNVTGSLHMGHALNNTLQDILSRFERMRGKSVLWQPGTDHAGIATQMVVERQLAAAGGNEDRRSMGREAFVERVWQWKEESGGQIINQLRRLGASCDWSRERFTMGKDGSSDDQMVKAVLKVFVQLHSEGLIYRDKRLVNWDPHFETAISDLEVENREVDGHFWHFKYPLEGGETYEYVEKDEDGNITLRETRDYISIATTRPETMLGDGAVAVHPSDERYAPIVGKNVILPLADRAIPIITDEHPDPDFGSGAVKITGAHDFNDYQVARRHKLPLHEIMDSKGRMLASDIMPEKYAGMDRFDARKAVVADIDALGLLAEIEDKKVMQPFGDRSNVVIEPMLTDQWYVNAEELAKPAIKAVEEGDTRFVPENWAKTYFQWMRNIEPWCISRQLWWGHRIPAWYGPDGEIFVADTEAAAQAAAETHYGKAVELRRDEDVLDTWFSSALWPFSTLGWPEETAEVKKHYPTSTLVTAHDIIFFWVARMMMMGMHFQKEIPFKDVYIHALVLDEHGQKMSKSKGNVIDPLKLIDAYGADALRFTMAAQAAQGRNIRLSEARVEGYRNFGTKLWNASRFCEMNECKLDPAFDPGRVQSSINKWIVHEANECAASVTRELEAYRFNDAAGAIYKFSWNIFCDWYLELAKPALQGDDGAEKTETRAAAAWALGRILKLLHPFMPFITEELWGALGEKDNQLVVSTWPQHDAGLVNDAAAKEMNWVNDVIKETRSIRMQANVPAAAKIALAHFSSTPEHIEWLERNSDLIKRLARLSSINSERSRKTNKDEVVFIAGSANFAISIGGVIDIAAEKARLEKEQAKAAKEIDGIDKKLANKNFVERAPKEVVEEQHTRRTAFEAELEKLGAALERLKSL